MTSPQRNELRSLVGNLVSSAPTTAEADGRPALWSLITDAELDSVAVPESAGGAGGTLADLVAVVEALGEAAVSVPLIEVSTARWLLAHNGSCNSGQLPVVAVDSATPLTSLPVPWGRYSDLVVVCAADKQPWAYHLAPGSCVVASRHNLAGEPVDILDLSAAPGTAIEGAPTESAIAARMASLWSAALLGASRGAYLRTRTHVRTREQFGAPLVKIPAVAGTLAGLRAELALAEAAVAQAIPAVPNDHPDLFATAAARVITSRCATVAARTAHQLHGALGITEEAGLHHFSKRLWAWQDTAGTEREWAITLTEAALDGHESWTWDHMTGV